MRALYHLLRSAKLRSFRKGDIILSEASMDRNLFYIRKGLVRSYILNEQAEDITFQLYAETNVFANIHCVLFDEPSRFYYQAIENTKAYSLDYDALLKISAQNSGMFESTHKMFGREIMKRAFQRAESFVFLNPEERYQKFVMEHAKIIHRVPDMYIAHVLGITPVSLSRIRRRLAERR